MRPSAAPTRSAAAFVLILAMAGIAAAPARAPAPTVDPSMAQPVATRLKPYLATGALDPMAIIGPPPAPGSAQGLADRSLFETTRAMAGTPRWTQAQRDNDLWNGAALKRYSCAIGHDIGERTTPLTQRLLRRVELDVPAVSKPAKDFYDRKRPVVGNTLPICVPREAWLDTNASYPSGHAMTGWAWGLILAELLPAKATAALDAGREVGQSRIICGVHFASDVEAGRVLGAAMVARLHAEPAFRADLQAARRELARAPAPHDCEG